MKICILSDSHDRSAPLVEAIVEAQEAGAQVVIHCGDLIGVNTLRASLKLGIPIHAVHGNNIGQYRRCGCALPHDCQVQRIVYLLR